MGSLLIAFIFPFIPFFNVLKEKEKRITKEEIAARFKSPPIKKPQPTKPEKSKGAEQKKD